MPETASRIELYPGGFAEVLRVRKPTPTELHDWKALWTWLLTPTPERVDTRTTR